MISVTLICKSTNHIIIFLFYFVSSKFLYSHPGIIIYIAENNKIIFLTIF